MSYMSKGYARKSEGQYNVLYCLRIIYIQGGFYVIRLFGKWGISAP